MLFKIIQTISTFWVSHTVWLESRFITSSPGVMNTRFIIVPFLLYPMLAYTPYTIAGCSAIIDSGLYGIRWHSLIRCLSSTCPLRRCPYCALKSKGYTIVYHSAVLSLKNMSLRHYRARKSIKSRRAHVINFLH